DDAFQHVAELVVVDLGARLGDDAIAPLVPAGIRAELHAFAEERAVAAFGELAGALAERAVLLAVPMAQRAEFLIGLPARAFHQARVHPGLAGFAHSVIGIGERAIMREFGPKTFSRVEDFVAIDVGVDVGKHALELLKRPHEEAVGWVAGDHAPNLLVALI